MPAVSFYLRREILDAVRARATSENIPVSKIISRAVEFYLQAEERKGARKRIMARIGQTIVPEEWEALHRERSQSGADRD